MMQAHGFPISSPGSNAPPVGPSPFHVIFRDKAVDQVPFAGL
jgi:hypothetical protein